MPTHQPVHLLREHHRGGFSQFGHVSNVETGLKQETHVVGTALALPVHCSPWCHKVLGCSHEYRTSQKTLTSQKRLCQGPPRCLSRSLGSGLGRPVALNLLQGLASELVGHEWARVSVHTGTSGMLSAPRPQAPPATRRGFRASKTSDPRATTEPCIPKHIPHFEGEGIPPGNPQKLACLFLAFSQPGRALTWPALQNPVASGHPALGPCKPRALPLAPFWVGALALHSSQRMAVSGIPLPHEPTVLGWTCCRSEAIPSWPPYTCASTLQWPLGQ